MEHAVAPAHPDPQVVEQLRDAWSTLLDRLAAASETVLGPGGATDNLEAAEGVRFLTRLASAAFDMLIEHGDTARPEFVRLMTPTRKFFGDNPDTLYDYASIRGSRRYRISGTRGATEYLAACVYGHEPDGSTRIVANVSDRDFPVTDGRFNLYLSPTPPPDDETGFWVQTTSDVDAVIVRQYQLRRGEELPAEFRIECLDDAGPGRLLDPSVLARRLDAAGRFVADGTVLSAAVAADLATRPNVPSIDSAAAGVAGFYPTPDNRYVGGWYSLGPNDALVVEGTPPDVRYWSLLLMSRWMESLDTRAHTTLLNCSQIALRPDGTFRVVVAHTDPGEPNWLDTAGHREGYLLFRWMQATDVPAPTFTVIPHPALHPAPSRDAERGRPEAG